MSNLSDITVAILAGGLGKRLRSKVYDRPKVLAEVGNTPFLQKLLDQISLAGFKNVVLCTGYLGSQIKEKFDSHYKNLVLSYSQEPLPLGTGGALRLALPILKSEIVLVMNGDSFCKVNLKEFWNFHLKKNSKASLVLSYVYETGRYGLIELDSDERIVSFSEKKKRSGGGWINVGIYLLDKSLISQIPEDKEISLEQDSFPTWINQGLYGYRSNGAFIDIGIPESYAKAEQFFEGIKV